MSVDAPVSHTANDTGLTLRLTLNVNAEDELALDLAARSSGTAPTGQQKPAKASKSQQKPAKEPQQPQIAVEAREALAKLTEGRARQEEPRDSRSGDGSSSSSSRNGRSTNRRRCRNSL